MRLMEEARHQKFPLRQPADGSKQPEMKQEKKNSFEVVEHAMVHAPPASSATPPTSYNKRCTESKGVNPLYEYARSKQGKTVVCYVLHLYYFIHNFTAWFTVFLVHCLA